MFLQKARPWFVFCHKSLQILCLKEGQSCGQFCSSWLTTPAAISEQFHFTTALPFEMIHNSPALLKKKIQTDPAKHSETAAGHLHHILLHSLWHPAKIICSCLTIKAKFWLSFGYPHFSSSHFFVQLWRTTLSSERREVTCNTGKRSALKPPTLSLCKNYATFCTQQK